MQSLNYCTMFCLPFYFQLVDVELERDSIDPETGQKSFPELVNIPPPVTSDLLPPSENPSGGPVCSGGIYFPLHVHLTQLEFLIITMLFLLYDLLHGNAHNAWCRALQTLCEIFP